MFEGVSSFRHLGKIIDKEGRIGVCVKDRIQAYKNTEEDIRAGTRGGYLEN
jgi:hypothetical protein